MKIRLIYLENSSKKKMIKSCKSVNLRRSGHVALRGPRHRIEQAFFRQFGDSLVDFLLRKRDQSSGRRRRLACRLLWGAAKKLFLVAKMSVILDHLIWWKTGIQLLILCDENRIFHQIWADMSVFVRTDRRFNAVYPSKMTNNWSKLHK